MDLLLVHRQALGSPGLGPEHWEPRGRPLPSDEFVQGSRALGHWLSQDHRSGCLVSQMLLSNKVALSCLLMGRADQCADPQENKCAQMFFLLYNLWPRQPNQ